MALQRPRSWTEIEEDEAYKALAPDRKLKLLGHWTDQVQTYATATGALSRDYNVSALNDFRSQKEQEIAAAAAPPPEKPFFRLGDVASELAGVPRDLYYGVPVAMRRLTEGLTRPDQYSEGTRESFEKERERLEQDQKERQEKELRGETSVMGDWIDQASQSAAFSVANMATALPASVAAGATVAAAFPPAAKVTGPLTVAASAGAAMLASAPVAYRIASNQFMDEAFAEMTKQKGSPLTEEEAQKAYEELLPIAQNTGLWEAGPEAVGNAVTLGVGKFVFGFGKDRAVELASKALGKAGQTTSKEYAINAAAMALAKTGVKASTAEMIEATAKQAMTEAGKTGIRRAVEKTAAVLGEAGVETTTEAITQTQQGYDQARMQQYVQTGSTEGAVNEYEGLAGFGKAYKEVFGPTIATLGMFGTTAGAIKVASNVMPGNNQQKKEQVISDIVAGAAAMTNNLNETGSPATAKVMGDVAAKQAQKILSDQQNQEDADDNTTREILDDMEAKAAAEKPPTADTTTTTTTTTEPTATSPEDAEAQSKAALARYQKGEITFDELSRINTALNRQQRNVARGEGSNPLQQYVDKAKLYSNDVLDLLFEYGGVEAQTLADVQNPEAVVAWLKRNDIGERNRAWRGRTLTPFGDQGAGTPLFDQAPKEPTAPVTPPVPAQFSPETLAGLDDNDFNESDRVVRGSIERLPDGDPRKAVAQAALVNIEAERARRGAAAPAPTAPTAPAPTAVTPAPAPTTPPPAPRTLDQFTDDELDQESTILERQAENETDPVRVEEINTQIQAVAAERQRRTAPPVASASAAPPIAAAAPAPAAPAPAAPNPFIESGAVSPGVPGTPVDPNRLDATTLEQKNPLGLRVAAKTPGGEIIAGKSGEAHFNLDYPEGSDLGFIDRDGNYLTRSEAAEAQTQAVNRPVAPAPAPSAPGVTTTPTDDLVLESGQPAPPAPKAQLPKKPVVTESPNQGQLTLGEGTQDTGRDVTIAPPQPTEGAPAPGSLGAYRQELADEARTARRLSPTRNLDQVTEELKTKQWLPARYRSDVMRRKYARQLLDEARAARSAELGMGTKTVVQGSQAEAAVYDDSLSSGEVPSARKIFNRLTREAGIGKKTGNVQKDAEREAKLVPIRQQARDIETEANRLVAANLGIPNPESVSFAPDFAGKNTLPQRSVTKGKTTKLENVFVNDSEITARQLDRGMEITIPKDQRNNVAEGITYDRKTGRVTAAVSGDTIVSRPDQLKVKRDTKRKKLDATFSIPEESKEKLGPNGKPNANGKTRFEWAIERARELTGEVEKKWNATITNIVRAEIPGWSANLQERVREVAMVIAAESALKGKNITAADAIKQSSKKFTERVRTRPDLATEYSLDQTVGESGATGYDVTPDGPQRDVGPQGARSDVDKLIRRMSNAEASRALTDLSQKQDEGKTLTNAEKQVFEAAEAFTQLRDRLRSQGKLDNVPENELAELTYGELLTISGEDPQLQGRFADETMGAGAAQTSAPNIDNLPDDSYLSADSAVNPEEEEKIEVTEEDIAKAKALVDSVRRTMPMIGRIIETLYRGARAFVTAGRRDAVYVNFANIARAIQGLDEDAARTFIKRLLNHEGRHLALLRNMTLDELKEIGNNMTQAQKLAAGMSYYANYTYTNEDQRAADLKKFMNDPTTMAMEYLTMLSERMTAGESVQDLDLKNFPKTTLQKIIAALRAILMQFQTRMLMRSEYNAALAIGVERLEKGIRDLENEATMAEQIEEANAESEAKERFMVYAGERALKPQFLDDSFKAAQAMAANGKTSEQIRAATGWFQGPYDGKMRWEIPDYGAVVNPSALDPQTKGAAPQSMEELDKLRLNALANVFLGERSPVTVVDKDNGETIIAADRKITGSVLNKLSSVRDATRLEIDQGPVQQKIFEIFDKFYPYQGWQNILKKTGRLEDVLIHDELYNSYPQLKDVSVRITKDSKGYTAQWDSNNLTINVNSEVSPNSREFLTSVLHEIQHAIQDYEGFAQGANLYTALEQVTSADQMSTVVPELKESLKTKLKNRKREAEFYQDVIKELSKSTNLSASRNVTQLLNEVYDKAANQKLTASQLLEEDGPKLTNALEKAAPGLSSGDVAIAVYDLIKYYAQIADVITVESDVVSNLMEMRWDASSAANDYEDLLDGVVSNNLTSIKLAASENPEVLLKLYRRSSGEIEARDIETRSRFTEDQLARVAPFSYENISPELAILPDQALTKVDSPADIFREERDFGAGFFQSRADDYTPEIPGGTATPNEITLIQQKNRDAAKAYLDTLPPGAYDVVDENGDPVGSIEVRMQVRTGTQRKEGISPTKTKIRPEGPQDLFDFMDEREIRGFGPQTTAPVRSLSFIDTNGMPQPTSRALDALVPNPKGKDWSVRSVVPQQRFESRDSGYTDVLSGKFGKVTTPTETQTQRPETRVINGKTYYKDKEGLWSPGRGVSKEVEIPAYGLTGELLNRFAEEVVDTAAKLTSGYEKTALLEAFRFNTRFAQGVERLESIRSAETAEELVQKLLDAGFDYESTVERKSDGEQYRLSLSGKSKEFTWYSRADDLGVDDDGFLRPMQDAKGRTVFRVKINNIPFETTAIDAEEAVRNAAARMFDNAKVVKFEGGTYTSVGGLVAAMTKNAKVWWGKNWANRYARPAVRKAPDRTPILPIRESEQMEFPLLFASMADPSMRVRVGQVNPEGRPKGGFWDRLKLMVRGRYSETKKRTGGISGSGAATPLERDAMIAQQARIKGTIVKAESMVKNYRRERKKHKDFTDEQINAALGTTENPYTDAQVKELGKIKDAKAREAKREEFRKANANTDRQIRLQALSQLPGFNPKYDGETEFHTGLAKAVEDMRIAIDEMSQALMAGDYIPADLKPRVEQNLNVYVHRSYTIFDNPEWKRFMLEPQTDEHRRIQTAAVRLFQKYAVAEIAQELRAEAKKANAPMSQRDAIRLASRERERIATRAGNMLVDYLSIADDKSNNFFVTGELPGQRKLDIIKVRGQIPKEVRELWGEIQKADDNFVKTMSKMAGYMSATDTARELVRIGLEQKYMWKEGVSEGERPAGFHLIYRPGDASPTSVSPMNGVYAPAEVGEFMRSFRDHKTMYGWARQLAFLTAGTMAMKTIGNFPQGYVRNFFGNPFIMINDGYINPMHPAEMFKAAKKAFKLALTSSGLRNNEAIVKSVSELTSAGLIGEGVDSSLMREMTDTGLGDLTWDKLYEAGAYETAMKRAARQATGATRGTFEFFARIYQGVDDFWKVFAYEMEKFYQRRAHTDWTEAQISKEAIDRVRNKVPTYSLSPELTRNIRNIPFIAPFITWTSETIRTSANNLAIAAEDIRVGKETKNPEMVRNGWRAIRGFAFALGAFPTLAMISKAIFGYDDDDEDAYREGLPEWEQNASLVFLGKAADGTGRHWNASFLDPYQSRMEGPIAFMRAMRNGDAFTDALVKGGMETLRPLLSEQLLFGAITSILRNRTAQGKPIYNEQDTAFNKTRDTMGYLALAAGPGTVVGAGRRLYLASQGTVLPTGQTYDVGNELLGMFGGQKVSSIDFRTTLNRAKNKYASSRAEATQLFSRTFSSQGSVDLQDIGPAYENAARAHRELQEEMMRAFDNAIRMGVPRKDAIQILRGSMGGAEVSKDDLRAILSGKPRRWAPSEVSLDSAKEGKIPDGRARLKALRDYMRSVKGTSEQ